LVYYLLLTWGLLAHAEIVDRVIAVVGTEGEQVVTASDVALEGALTPLDHGPTPFWVGVHDDASERLIEAAVVRAAAADVALYQPSPEDVAARVQAFRGRIGDPAALVAFQTRWGLDDAGLAVALRRRMVVERYLTRNLPTPPEDAEAWLAEVHDALEALSLRVPVRRIEPQP